MIYLASPYLHPDPMVREQRFDDACEFAARLIRAGAVVFSAIAYSHPMVRFGCGDGWAHWKRLDTEMIRLAAAVVVLKLDGWQQSAGVLAEVKLAESLSIPIVWAEEEDGPEVVLGAVLESQRAVWVSSSPPLSSRRTPSR